MLLYKNLKLKWKIIIPYVILVGLVAATMIVWYVVFEIDREKVRQYWRMDMQIESLAEACSHPLAVREYNRIQELLQHIANDDPDISYLFLTTKKGTIIAADTPRLHGKTIAELSKNKDSLLPQKHDPYIYEITHPVTIFNIVLGQLTLGVSTQSIYTTMQNFTGLIILVATVAIFTGTLLYSWIIRITVSRPIQNLRDAAMRISTGHFEEKLTYSSADELGVLAQAFNNMSAQLATTLSGLNIEIKERLLAENEQKKLLAIIENTTDLIAGFKPNGSIIFINKAGKELLGWQPDQKFSDQNINDIFPERAYLLFKKALTDEVAQMGHWMGESTLLDYAGRQRPISQVIIAHKNAAGIIEYYSTIIRDISQLKAVEEELLNSRENLRITLNSIGDGVIVCDTHGAITRMNAVAEELTGWRIEDAKGKPFPQIFNIISKDPQQPVENPVEQVMATGIITGLADGTELMSKTGEHYIIADSGAPIRNRAGDIVGVVLVFRDITEKYKLEQQLQQQQKMESLGRLAGGIAHDFNNMLGGILGCAEILAARQKDPKLSKLSKTIVDAALRANDLTSKLLAFSRKGKMVTITSDLHAIIKETQSILEHTIDKRIQLISNFLAKDSTVIGDPSQLQNAILNLCLNACDAMPEGGTLTLLTENTVLDENYCKISPFELVAGNYIKITVSDTGRGIKPENQQKIFEPFFTTKTIGKGTGLGLAAVYGTVKDHLGAVTVYSEVGKGTDFHLYLPGHSKVKTSSRIGILDKEIKGQGHILLVDDEIIIRDTGKEMLIDLGYEVTVAENGVEGLRLFKAADNTFDLVLLDLVMPEMDGKECFTEMIKHSPNAKIILSSGFTKDFTISNLQDKGLAGFIKKPYSKAKLSQVIASILQPQS